MRSRARGSDLPEGFVPPDLPATPGLEGLARLANGAVLLRGRPAPSQPRPPAGAPLKMGGRDPKAKRRGRRQP